jgi:translocation and assembly module TamB
MTDRLRAGLGLDRLGLTSDPTNSNAAAVEAGRYVARGVFLSVRQGTTGNTGVAAQVELTPRLRLEGQTATGAAGDRLGLSYELEY